MLNVQCPMTNDQSKYPLLPFSQLVYDMTRWMPGVYRFPVTLRWKDGAKEKDRIESAFRMALANHPVFSMRVDRKGMHYAAELKDILHGAYHDINLSVDGKDVLLHISANRILGDGRSAEILMEDIERAYKGLPLRADDYWGYMARYEQQKSEPHYIQSKEWLEEEFADESIPVRPTIDRKRLTTILPPKAGYYQEDYTSQREQISRFANEHHLTLDGLFSLCAALAIADYCGTDEAALTWAYEGRETEEEQRIFGSLHRDVPFKIRKSKIENRLSAIRFARNQIRSGIAHSDYPYTLTAPFTKRWNYAVNVLHAEDVDDMLRKTSLPLEIVSIPEQKYAYALLDIEIHEKGTSLSLIYRYSATHYKESSIKKFAALVRKYVEWLVKSEK